MIAPEELQIFHEFEVAYKGGFVPTFTTAGFLTSAYNGLLGTVSLNVHFDPVQKDYIKKYLEAYWQDQQAQLVKMLSLQPNGSIVLHSLVGSWVEAQYVPAGAAIDGSAGHAPDGGVCLITDGAVLTAGWITPDGVLNKTSYASWVPWDKWLALTTLLRAFVTRPYEVLMEQLEDFQHCPICKKGGGGHYACAALYDMEYLQPVTGIDYGKMSIAFPDFQAMPKGPKLKFLGTPQDKPGWLDVDYSLAEAKVAQHYVGMDVGAGDHMGMSVAAMSDGKMKTLFMKTDLYDKIAKAGKGLSGGITSDTQSDELENILHHLNTYLVVPHPPKVILSFSTEYTSYTVTDVLLKVVTAGMGTFKILLKGKIAKFAVEKAALGAYLELDSSSQMYLVSLSATQVSALYQVLTGHY